MVEDVDRFLDSMERRRRTLERFDQRRVRAKPVTVDQSDNEDLIFGEVYEKDPYHDELRSFRQHYRLVHTGKWPSQE